MIQPDIALAVKTPQIDNPLETAGKVLAIRGQQANLAAHQQQMALNDQHLQAGALSLQEAKLKQSDDQAISQAWQQAGGDPDKHVQIAAASGARPQAVQALQKHYADIVEQKAKTSKDQADAQKQEDDQFSGLVNGLLQTPDEQYPAAYQQALAIAKQRNPKLQLPAEAPSKDVLGHIALAYKTNTILDQQAAEKRAQQESDAKLPGIKADSDVKVAEARGINMSPVDAKQRVDAVIDPAKYPDQNARALAMYNNALTLKDKNAALEKVSGEIGGMEAKTNPAVLKSEIDQKVKEQRALIPGEVSKALSIETATNPLKLQQARAVAGATSGTREALKLDQDYVKVAGATQQMGKLLDLADQGNKAAASSLATVGAVTVNAINGLKRLTRQEIEGLGGSGAGDAYDRVVGFFGKATAGQAIPANIRDDIRTLHQTLGENAYHEYTTGLDALSKRSGTTYAPTVAAPNIQKGSTALSTGHKVGEVVTVSGKKYKISKVLPDDKFEADEVK